MYLPGCKGSLSNAFRPTFVVGALTITSCHAGQTNQSLTSDQSLVSRNITGSLTLTGPDWTCLDYERFKKWRS